MAMIQIVGLGAGDYKQLPIGVYEQIKRADALYLRTKNHPVVDELDSQGINYTSFDDIYERHERFEQVYEEIVSTLFTEGIEKGEIVYAVPGHPMVAEKTVQLLMERAQEYGCQIQVGGGQSFIDPLLTRLQVDPVEGFLLLDALSFEVKDLVPSCHVVLTQVYDAYVASEVKLTLMEVYPDDFLVTVATAVGSNEEHVQTIPLYELDRVTQVNNLTAVYIPKTDEDSVNKRLYSRSREIFRTLRGPNGCPWDREQTHSSLNKYLLEEAQEAVEAIEEEDVDHLIEELGDVLLQVFLHAQIGEDEGMFTMEDVLQSLNEKMIRRHPHVFGDKTIQESGDVIKQWKEIKEAEQIQKKEQNK